MVLADTPSFARSRPECVRTAVMQRDAQDAQESPSSPRWAILGQLMGPPPLSAFGFDPTIDLTGVATALLAVATAWLGWSTRRAATATKAESEATREQAVLSHRQLGAADEQLQLAHEQLAESTRPVVVSLNKSASTITTSGAALPAVPHSNGSDYLVPVRNIGSGPALNIRCSVTSAKDARRFASGSRTAMAVGDHAFMRVFTVETDAMDHAHLDISYSGIGGQRYMTKVRLNAMADPPYFYDISVAEVREVGAIEVPESGVPTTRAG